MTDISLTIFKNLYDTATDKVMELGSFDDLEDLLYQLSTVERNGKKDSYLISPACYADGTNRRANENVTHWSAWAAMDIDNHDFESEDLHDELFRNYGHFRFVCYSTAGSLGTAPKFRLVFPLTRPVRGENIRHFWYALNAELGDIGDPQTKDLSRMYYIPASYAGAHNFIFSNWGGGDIDPDALTAKHPVDPSKIASSGSGGSFIDRLPKSMQDQILAHRRMNSPTAGANIRWTGYHDCPFINRSLLEEYKSIAHIDGTGRYAMVYRIMVSIAVSAVRANYPITVNEIVSLIRELDSDTSNRYHKRRLDVEADRAIEFAYRNM